ncbi:MAG: hypothetical protein KatS3mg060_0034 [Dehalococcoidia bacterium]|jgi:hypothetical protein|nr:MAG: hypothetical protein KatS3mg060_0034 [Dehalococcoidia bacterium]
MGNCPVPFLFAFLAPFVLAMFRTAGRKPKSPGVTPLTRTPGQYLPKRPAEGEPLSVR